MRDDARAIRLADSVRQPPVVFAPTDSHPAADLWRRDADDGTNSCGDILGQRDDRTADNDP
jgi:hypothetical protein